MNIMRLNFSHGSHEQHGQCIANLQQSVAETPLDGRMVRSCRDGLMRWPADMGAEMAAPRACCRWALLWSYKSTGSGLSCSGSSRSC